MMLVRYRRTGMDDQESQDGAAALALIGPFILFVVCIGLLIAAIL